ncbi:MAG: cysteine--tRNA ligase, partial [Alphaproteobacteria bacterium]|nr:cysteine--tRNA ligase [Alphaproteobacteria bacterium]
SGEFLTLSVLKNRGYDPMAYRYMLLRGHYQSQLAFSWDGLDAASNGYKNMVRRAAEIISAQNQGTLDSVVFDEWHDKILGAVSDNLKTAEALVFVQELIKNPTINAATKQALLEFIDRLLGLRLVDAAKKQLSLENAAVPAEILAMADARSAAKSARDWARADALRTQIEEAGWSVIDTKDGVKIVKKA